MAELDKTGLEAAAKSVERFDFALVLHDLRAPRGEMRQSSDGEWVRYSDVSAYLSSTSAGVTEEQTPEGEDAHIIAVIEREIGSWECEGPRGLTTVVDLVAAERELYRAALEASRVATVSQKEAVPVAWQWRMRVAIGDGWGEWCDWREGKKWVTTHEGEAEYEERPLYASPAPAVEPVGIKALEWSTEFSGTPRADDTFGRHYLVYQEFNSGWVLCIDGMRVKDQIPSSAEAQAAAQADYERRIRSALHPTPTPVSAPVITRCQCEHPSLIHQFGKGYHCTRCGLPPRMNLNITKEWFERKAAEEGDHEIGVGSPVSAPVGVVEECERLRGTLRYILAQAEQGYPTVLSVIKANAKAALDDKWQATVREAIATLRSPAVEGK